MEILTSENKMDLRRSKIILKCKSVWNDIKIDNILFWILFKAVDIK